MPDQVDEGWLRDGLADAVPEPPRVPHRAAAAREQASRARRRTTTVVLVGAVVVAAAVAVTTLTVDRTPDAPPASGPTKGTEELGPYDPPVCPPPPRPGSRGPSDHLDHPDPGLPDAVPEGATSVRLCGGVGMSFAVPSDALVTSVDQMVAAVDDLGRAEPPTSCTDELGVGYRLSFGYADGSTFVVSGKMYGCDEVVVGSGYRVGAERPFNDFLDLLARQRATLEPPDFVSMIAFSCTPDPGDPVARLLVKPTDIVRGVLCVGDSNRPEDAVQVPIPADDLTVLKASMVEDAYSVSGALGCRPQPIHYWIVGAGPWGDPVWITEDCGDLGVGPNLDWSPHGDAKRILDTLAARAR